MYFDLSKKSRYAVLALCELVLLGTQTPINARSLAQKHQLPVRFLEIILNELKQAGFVHSIRGKAGGYILARPAGAISLAEVIGFLESAPSQSPQRPEPALSGEFILNSLVLEANRHIAEQFERCSLEELVRRELEHQTQRAPNYVI